MTSPLHPVWRDYRTRRRALAAAIVGLVPVLTRAGTAQPHAGRAFTRR